MLKFNLFYSSLFYAFCPFKRDFLLYKRQAGMKCQGLGGFINYFSRPVAAQVSHLRIEHLMLLFSEILVAAKKSWRNLIALSYKEPRVF